MPAALHPGGPPVGSESRGTCHPGVRRSLAAIRQRFWCGHPWPRMSDSLCWLARCAQNKTSNQSPVGLLQPLPIPSCPWSHLALNFVSGPSPSRATPVILTVVDRLSKRPISFPCPNSPPPRRLHRWCEDHIFRIHGLPVDVVSDRGPQFVSQFWKEFCRQIGGPQRVCPQVSPSDQWAVRASQPGS